MNDLKPTSISSNKLIDCINNNINSNKILKMYTYLQNWCYNTDDFKVYIYHIYQKIHPIIYN